MCALMSRVCVGMSMEHVWMSEDNLMKLLLSFHFYVGSGVQTRSLGLCGKPLYLLSHLARPDCVILKITVISMTNMSSLSLRKENIKY